MCVANGIVFNYIFLCRPDQAVFNGEDEDHLNSRDMSDEPWRRQVINNLAKHVLFSKGNLKTMMHKQFLGQWGIFQAQRVADWAKLMFMWDQQIYNEK